MEYYSEEEKKICKLKIESEGKEMLSQRGCLSTREINEMASNFYCDLVSSPKSVYAIPISIVSKPDIQILAIIFIDILQKNRYEIWFVDKTKMKTHPWRCGGTLIECSKEYETVEAATAAAKDRILKFSEHSN